MTSLTRFYNCQRLASLGEAELSPTNSAALRCGSRGFCSAHVRLKNTETGEETRLEIDGLFLAVGTEPENEPYKAVTEQNDYGYIVADESCRTGKDGIYVAGDCRTKTYRQVATAIADGATAALNACRYLDA